MHDLCVKSVTPTLSRTLRAAETSARHALLDNSPNNRFIPRAANGDAACRNTALSSASALQRTRLMVAVARATSKPGILTTVPNTELYEELGLEPSASKAEIKKAYRQRALQYHPDVNSSDDAEEMFIRLSRAYEVLMDEEERAKYDKYGLQGLDSGWEHRNAGQTSWDAFDTWEEFKPFKRKTRRGDAREAAASRGLAAESEEDLDQVGGARGAHGTAEAQLGDVVEYPLSDAAKGRLQDGRQKGVGFIVGRNKDRGDWQRLPPENLSLVEIEPLCLEGDSWKADHLESSAFAQLEDLRVLRTEFDKRFDSWKLLDDLSDGCGSPVYEEEIIL